MQSLLMQYLIFGNNFTGTPSEHFQADECGKHSICENKISLNPQNTCSFMLVFNVSLLETASLSHFLAYERPWKRVWKGAIFHSLPQSLLISFSNLRSLNFFNPEGHCRDINGSLAGSMHISLFSTIIREIMSTTYQRRRKLLSNILTNQHV